MDDLEIDKEEHTNAKLAQELTENTWKDLSNSVDTLSSKLATILGFGGVVLKFTNDLPGDTDYLRVIKACVCLCVITAIGLCTFGLIPRGSGKNMLTPDDLLETEWFYKPDWECRLRISRCIRDAIKGLEKVRTLRAECVFYAICSLATASTLFGISIILKTFQPETDHFLCEMFALLQNGN
jgi:hypothetical protein